MQVCKQRNAMIKEDLAVSDGHSSCPAQTSSRFGPAKLWGIRHGHFAAMGGFKLYIQGEAPDDDTVRAQGKRVTLSGVVLLAKCGVLPPTSQIDLAIEAGEKSNYLAKTLVCIQISWLVVQAVARKASGLPVTLLEVNTIGQVWCAFVLYGIWWFKPQGLDAGLTIDVTFCKTCRQRIEMHGFWKHEHLSSRNALYGNAYQERVDFYENDGTVQGKASLINTGVTLFVWLGYAGIHLSAWDAEFASWGDCMLWRCASCMLVASLLILGGGNYSLYSGFISEDPGCFLVVLGGVLSALARAGLIVEAFISLRRLPVGAYLTPPWTEMIPHIG
jgi:hypothetical protein